MDRRGIFQKDEVSHLKEKFKKKFINTTQAIENKSSVNSLAQLSKFLNNVPEKHHEVIILQKITKKEDALQYALNKKCYKLFLVLINKIDAREYFQTNDLLQVAIESKDDKQVDTVLRAYERSEVRFVLSALPDRTKGLLYDGNWNKDVIERLYPYTTSYFIPRGQNKAKMFSLTCYTT